MVTRIMEVPSRFRKISLVVTIRTMLLKIRGILRYPKRRRKERLYKQWVENAGLPPRYFSRG